MEPLKITGLDGTEYLVYAIKWLVMNELQVKRTDINVKTQIVTFDEIGYRNDLFKAAVEVLGPQRHFITDKDMSELDGKTGLLLQRAVNKMNALSPDEIQNLSMVQPQITPKIQLSVSSTS